MNRFVNMAFALMFCFYLSMIFLDEAQASVLFFPNVDYDVGSDPDSIAMGDFNDEPFNRSVLEELMASSGFDRLEEPVKKSGGNEHLPGVVPYAKLQAPLFNCMWPPLATTTRTCSAVSMPQSAPPTSLSTRC